jgi:hypothetical protein
LKPMDMKEKGCAPGIGVFFSKAKCYVLQVWSNLDGFQSTWLTKFTVCPVI